MLKYHLINCYELYALSIMSCLPVNIPVFKDKLQKLKNYGVVVIVVVVLCSKHEDKQNICSHVKNF